MKVINKNFPIASSTKQNGAVLIISLVILIALTIIVLTSARSSVLELTMGVNSESQAEALADAEDAVRAGETFLQSQFDAGILLRDQVTADPADGLHANGDIALTMDWATNGTPTFKELNAANEIINEYTIEYVGIMQDSLGGATAALGDRLVYRVSGLGRSSNGSARIVQTYYATLSN